MTRKKDLYEALLRLSEDRSVHMINIRDIAKESKVSIGTIYNNYNSKSEMISDIYMMIKDELFELFTNNYDKENGLLSIVNIYLDYGFANKEKIKFLTQPDIKSEITLEVKRKIEDKWSELIKDNIKTENVEAGFLIITATLEKYIFNYEKRDKLLESKFIETFKYLNEMN